MTQQCKTWFVPTDRFRGLCSQLYDPVTGTNECPVCVQPYMMDEVVDCGPCLTTDEFSPVYKIVTKFDPPGSNLDGGLYTMSRAWTNPTTNTTTSVSYNRYLFTFNWDDLVKLWNSPMVRTQTLAKPKDPDSILDQEDSENCYVNTCGWAKSITQVVGYNNLPMRRFNPGSAPQKNNNFFRGVTKSNWPQRITTSQWHPRYAGQSCSFYSAGDEEYHLSVTTSQGQKPIYTPDRNERWPEGFGSLSGTPMKSFKFQTGGNGDWQKNPYGLAYPEVDNWLQKSGVQGVMTLHIGMAVFKVPYSNKIYWRFNIFNRYYEVCWMEIYDEWYGAYLPWLSTWGPPTNILLPEEAFAMLGPQPGNPDWLHPHQGEGLYSNNKGVPQITSFREEYVQYKSDPMPCSSRNLFTVTRINSGGSPARTPSVYPDKIIIKAGS